MSTTPAEPILLEGVAGYLRSIGKQVMAQLIDDAIAVLKPHMLPGGSVPAIDPANLLASLRDLRHEIVFDDEGDMTRAEFDAMLAKADAAIAMAGGNV